MVDWRADMLGAGFECTDLDLGADDEGPLVATLVRALPAASTARVPARRTGLLPAIRRGIAALGDRLAGREPGAHAAADAAAGILADVDVLYVHGWSDYFFQRDVARFWTDRGARFHALDLRKCGRSLRPGQSAGYITDLDEYGREIELALAAIADEAAGDPEPRRLILFGHSTGGLVLSLWAAQHPGRADALILNSPWLEFQLSATGRQLLTPIVSLSARINPLDVAPQLDFGFYTRAQREVGPADELAGVDERWRPKRSLPVRGGWLKAVLAGHARVSRGLGIAAPALVLLSARSIIQARWSDDMTRADTVLEVAGIAQAALQLGSSVTVERIEGALHDVFLSAEDARADAFARLDRWVTGWHAACPPRSTAPAAGAGPVVDAPHPPAADASPGPAADAPAGQDE